MIKIDPKRCIGCKACVNDCLGGAIRLEEGKAVYIKDCFHCGHCVAVCPTGAVTIPEYDMEEVEEYDADTFSIKPENFLHAVKFRRSVRNYKETPIEPEKMVRILNAGRYTATARNTQDCRFILIQKELDAFKELVWQEISHLTEKMGKEDPLAKMFQLFYLRQKRDKKDDALFFNAPSVLVITPGVEILDGGLAAANIEQMAVASGAGVLYNGYLMHVIEGSERLKEWLGITGEQVACCMLMGYPAVTYRRTAPRKKGKIEWR